MNEDKELALLVELHRDTPRQGPGSTSSTLKALSSLPAFDESQTILDLGCGSGAQTEVLFEATEASIIAVDLFEVFLDKARHRFEGRADAHRVRVEVGDMFQLSYADEEFDLIWSEGALYIAGIEKAVELLWPLLKNRGYLGFTELTWLDTEAPVECQQYWAEQYPGMKSVPENCRILERGGFSILETFPLETSAWLDQYYGPLRKRIPGMRSKYETDPDAQALLDATEEEIRLFERFHEHYNYVFYLARRAS